MRRRRYSEALGYQDGEGKVIANDFEFNFLDSK